MHFKLIHFIVFITAFISLGEKKCFAQTITHIKILAQQFQYTRTTFGYNRKRDFKFRKYYFESSSDFIETTIRLARLTSF